MSIDHIPYNPLVELNVHFSMEAMVRKHRDDCYQELMSAAKRRYGLLLLLGEELQCRREQAVKLRV